MSLTSKDIQEAAVRAGRWVAAQLMPMGNYKGKESQRPDGTFPDTDDLGCYYKSIYLLRTTGHSEEAGRCLRYIINRFQSSEGDYYNSPELRSGGRYGPLFSQLYPNAWLMRGAASLHWFGLARSILTFMNTQREPEFGGYYTHVNSKTGMLDSNSTAVGAFCCILGGEYKLAKKSCNLLLKMLANQEDKGILWSRCRKDGTLVKDLADIAPENHRFARLSSAEPEQAYWIWAWPMNTLIAMYELTAQKKYIRAAVKIFSFLTQCHPHAFSYPTAGKNAWGAAKLYRHTGDRRYLEKALSQMRYILDHQHADGYMLNEGVKDESGQSKRITFDFTGDFGSWLIDNAAEFSFMGA